ncbi:hypothetical protein [Limnohabitans sp. Rim8]|uniref:hypothetical protein n=1 Tax=Limnohabitans sp. Rim8 TaxID=1100718 RepID=UPI0011B204F4|nr:hypothetical protein [Limnohabitans sp. Rim8]
MTENNVSVNGTINNATTGAEMQAAVNTTVTAPTIVEKIQEANLELANLAICEVETEQALYAALGKCYDICMYLESGSNTVALYEFNNYYKGTEFPNTSKVSLISKVLNCTFKGLNVSKRSAYKAVIQFAAAKEIVQGGLVAFINSYAGLQNTRLAKYATARANSAAPDYGTRLAQTQNYFAKQQVTTVPALVLEGVLPTQQVGEQFVLIAQRTADGNVVFNAVTAEGKAVKAVLNILYPANKVAIAADAQALKASLQTSFSSTATAPVPPDSFAAASYSTDALSNDGVQVLIKNAEARIASEEALA